MTDPYRPGSASVIYLVRHGQTVDPDSPRHYIGQTDIPLTAGGRRQARDLGAWFATIRPDRVVCSDLRRSRETARIIVEHLSPGKKGAEPITGLREIDLGAWDGLTMEAVKREAPDAWRRRGEDPAGFRPPGGESFADLQDRVVPVFEALARETPGRLVIVGHAGVNRVILCRILGMDLVNLFRLGQDPAGITIVLFGRNGWRVSVLNGCGHLKR